MRIQMTEIILPEIPVQFFQIINGNQLNLRFNPVHKIKLSMYSTRKKNNIFICQVQLFPGLVFGFPFIIRSEIFIRQVFLRGHEFGKLGIREYWCYNTLFLKMNQIV